MHSSWYLRPVFLAFAVYALLLSAQRFYFGPPNPQSCNAFYSRAGDAELTGKVLAFPRKADGAVWAEISVQNLRGAPSCGKIMAVLGPDADPKPGSFVTLSGKLLQAGSGKGISGQGYRRYLRSRGIYSVLESARISQLRPPNPLLRSVNSLRKRMLYTFEKTLGPERAAVLSGITIGERASISRELNRAFRDSGAMHILVASGSNVGFVTFLVFLLARGLKLSRLWAGFAAVALAGFYTLLAGADTPLVRAYIMSVFGTAGFLLERESGVLHGLVLAALAIIATDPQALFRPDFQMSFTSTAAILIALSAYKIPKRMDSWLGKKVYYLLISSVAAQIALFPLMASYFHRVSLAPLLSNFFVMPVAALLMGSGFALTLLSWFNPLLPLAGALLKLPLDFLIWLVQNSASWGLVLETARPSGAMTVCFYSCALLFLHLPQKEVLSKLWKPVSALALASLLVGFAVPNAINAVVLGNSRNRSLLVTTQDRQLLLFGAAVNGDILADAVLDSGRRSVDALFISGSGGNSLAGFAALAKRIKISRIYGPYGPVEPELLGPLSGAQALWPGESVSGTGWQATLLWPFCLDQRLHLTRHTGYSGSGEEFYSWLLRLPELELETGAALHCARVRAHRDEFDIIFRRGGAVFSYSAGKLGLNDY